MSENNPYGLDYVSNLSEVMAEVIALMDDTSLDVLNVPPFVIAETDVDKDTQINVVLLAIGSNEQAAYHLANARGQLSKLGKMALSEPLVNPDFTATPESPKPDYTNQCVYIALDKALSFAELTEYFTAIETLCERKRSLDDEAESITDRALLNPPVKLVSMDIDVLGFRQQADGEWRLIQRRLPLKTHEKIGLQQLLTSALVISSPPITTLEDFL